MTGWGGASKELGYVHSANQLDAFGQTNWTLSVTLDTLAVG